MKITAIVWSIGVVISLVQFFEQAQYVVPDFAGVDKRQGFYDARLFGIFTDPNFAAVTSLICVLFCLFLFKQTHYKLLHLMYLLMIILNGSYIILSGSRTSYIAALTTFPIITYYLVRSRMRRKKKKYHLKGVISCAIVIVGICILFNYSSGVFADIAEITQIEEHEQSGHDGKKKKIDKIDMERKDIHGDISNNRLEIWKSVWEISADKRLIGLSPRNLVAYSKVNYPKSFISQTCYQAHNGYLALISGIGVLGTLPIVILFTLTFIWLVEYLYHHRGKDIDDILVISVGVCVILFVSAMFLLELFFTSTGTTTLFWIFFGTIFLYLSQKRKENKQAVAET